MIPVITDNEGKIVIFVKKDGSGFQQYPVPENLADFIEFKIDYLQELDFKIFIFNSGEVFLVDNPPEPKHYHYYDFEQKFWVVDAVKKSEYDTEHAKIKKAELIREIKNNMEPFQLAVELEIATDEEKAKLLELKKKLVEANRV